MDKKTFQRFLDRDGGRCYATGREGDTLVPQHRLGGMGGNRPENPAAILTFDSIVNGDIESDASWQRKAYGFGWKLRAGDDPLLVPCFHVYYGWRVLKDDFTFRAATRGEIDDLVLRETS